MNKAQLVEEVVSQTGLTKRAAEELVDRATSVITEALARGEKVTLVGFGTFRVMNKEARTGRNPRTGQAIQIGAKKVPRFRPGKGLREVI